MRGDSTYICPRDHTYLDRVINDKHHNWIIDHLLDLFSIEPGDRVVELGAGSGRYTELLLRRGLMVDAVEPDEFLIQKLTARLGEVPSLEVHLCGEESLPAIARGARLICGFHVLHHFRRENILTLRRAITQVARYNERLSGWFFVEPNPLNALYVLQIVFTKGMSFAEEKGLWHLGRNRLLASRRGRSVNLGTIGLFPPRPGLERLPEQVQAIATSLRPFPSLIRLYSVYGERLH